MSERNDTSTTLLNVAGKRIFPLSPAGNQSSERYTVIRFQCNHFVCSQTLLSNYARVAKGFLEPYIVIICSVAPHCVRGKRSTKEGTADFRFKYV